MTFKTWIQIQQSLKIFFGEEEEREGSFLKPIYTHGCKNALNACYQVTRNLL